MSQPPRREAQFLADRKDDSQESGRCRLFSRSSSNGWERCRLRRHFQQPPSIHPLTRCQLRAFGGGSGPVRSRLCGCRRRNDRLRAAQLRAQCAVCRKFEGTGAVHKISPCGARPRDAAGLKGDSLSSATVCGGLGYTTRGGWDGVDCSNFWGSCCAWSPTRILKTGNNVPRVISIPLMIDMQPAPNALAKTCRAERGRCNRSRPPQQEEAQTDRRRSSRRCITRKRRHVVW